MALNINLIITVGIIYNTFPLAAVYTIKLASSSLDCTKKVGGSNIMNTYLKIVLLKEVWYQKFS